MNRRNFLNAGIGLSIISLLPKQLVSCNTIDESKSAILKPSKLRLGDKIGLVASAWFVTANDLTLTVKKIEQLGFKPVYTNKILGKYGYFSGTDEERAADFNQMIQNPEVKGIVFIAGGYGCTRILDKIDYELIKENPKVIMGFSDNTALINAIYQKTKLITFHGPVAKTIHRDYNRKQFENIVVNPSDDYLIESTDEDLKKSASDKVYERYTIVSGKSQGELTGGNLTLLASMMGTPYQIEMKDKLVMIEDIGEEPYRIDRMLTQLIAGGELTKAAGIVVGICRKCDKTDKILAPNSFTLREVIEERIKPLGIPAAYGLSFGHNINNFTFPIGIKALFDADNKTIQLLERAVK